MIALELLEKAQKFGVCSRLTGRETMNDLVDLFLTVQGIEFCTENSFPDMVTLRLFKGGYAEEKGVYIDRDITLKNAEKIVLIGNSFGDLYYDDPKKGHEVILMHGARARIHAVGYAVVFVTNKGGAVEVIKQDNALVL